MTESNVPKEESMFREPILQPVELRRARVLDDPCGELAQPGVTDADIAGYLGLLACARRNRFARRLDPLFDGHRC